MEQPTDHEQTHAPADMVAAGAPAAPAVGPTAGPAGPQTRTVLTRVDVVAPVPEPAIDWCRHEVRRLVAGHLLGTAAIVAAAVVPVLRWQGVGWASAISLGLFAGLAAAVVRVVVTLVAGPLGLRYVRRYSATPPEYIQTHTASGTPTRDPVERRDGPDDEVTTLPDIWDLDGPTSELGGAAGSITLPTALIGSPERRGDPVPVEAVADGAVADGAVAGPAGDPDGTDDRSPRAAAASEALREMGLVPVAAVRTDGRPSSVVELFSDGDRIVAAVDRITGSVTLLTELVGFRVLVTSALLVPPTDELVVNVVDDDAPSALVVSHRRLVQAAVRSRALASDPVGLFKLAQQRELEAYRQLGPFWGAMLDLRCRPGGARLLSSPSAQDVLLFTGNRLFQQTR